MTEQQTVGYAVRTRELLQGAAIPLHARFRDCDEMAELLGNAAANRNRELVAEIVAGLENWNSYTCYHNIETLKLCASAALVALDQLEAEPQTAEVELSEGEVQVLRTLRQTAHPDESSLWRSINITMSYHSLKGVCRRLEQHGFVARSTGTQGNRWIYITDAGRSRLDEIEVAQNPAGA